MPEPADKTVSGEHIVTRRQSPSSTALNPFGPSKTSRKSFTALCATALLVASQTSANQDESPKPESQTFCHHRE